MRILKYYLPLFFVVLSQARNTEKVEFENLVFYNISDTIIFKEKELMKINGKKYRYLSCTKNDDNIRTLELGLLRGRNVEFSFEDIFTFQKY